MRTASERPNPAPLLRVFPLGRRAREPRSDSCQQPRAQTISLAPVFCSVTEGNCHPARRGCREPQNLQATELPSHRPRKRSRLAFQFKCAARNTVVGHSKPRGHASHPCHLDRGSNPGTSFGGRAHAGSRRELDTVAPEATFDHPNPPARHPNQMLPRRAALQPLPSRGQEAFAATQRTCYDAMHLPRATES
jgi:hypothetical protein